MLEWPHLIDTTRKSGVNKPWEASTRNLGLSCRSTPHHANLTCCFSCRLFVICRMQILLPLVTKRWRTPGPSFFCVVWMSPFLKKGPHSLPQFNNYLGGIFSCFATIAHLKKLFIRYSSTYNPKYLFKSYWTLNNMT